MQDKLPLAIVSDIACPWCYIGKTRLETALAQFGLRDPQRGDGALVLQHRADAGVENREIHRLG